MIFHSLGSTDSHTIMNYVDLNIAEFILKKEIIIVICIACWGNFTNIMNSHKVKIITYFLVVFTFASTCVYDVPTTACSSIPIDLEVNVDLDYGLWFKTIFIWFRTMQLMLTKKIWTEITIFIYSHRKYISNNSTDIYSQIFSLRERVEIHPLRNATPEKLYFIEIKGYDLEVKLEYVMKMKQKIIAFLMVVINENFSKECISSTLK